MYKTHSVLDITQMPQKIYISRHVYIHIYTLFNDLFSSYYNFFNEYVPCLSV